MISVFDLFKIGIGPSSSHTVGPMKAAHEFAANIERGGYLDDVSRVEVRLYGSLAWTGKGHGTDKAVILGLAGERPDTVDPDLADLLTVDIRTKHELRLLGRSPIFFDPEQAVIFDKTDNRIRHPNTLSFVAFDGEGRVLGAERWCSIGGGFVLPENEVGGTVPEVVAAPHRFRSGEELLAKGAGTGLSIADMVFANEQVLRSADEIENGIETLIGVMMACIDRGLRAEGELPGGLKVRRRAKILLARSEGDVHENLRLPNDVMDRVSLYAIAVNEENAAGGRIVTAPTNGAAGVIPAVLRYYSDYCPGASARGRRDFMLTATAIGSLFKLNASISGAEVGCQGEVGVACSMAAAGLVAAFGGSNAQIENAAEIGMEHHLGMTCDPVGGLVQIPCIERNAFGAVKAINAASLALHGDGSHRISLDQVIATMRQTGADMQTKYKETSLGGLAVNFTEC